MATSTKRRSGAVATKAKASKSKKRTAAPSARLVAKKNGRALPGWGDLPAVSGKPGRKKAGGKAARRRADAKLRALDTVPSLRFGLVTLLACVFVTLFVAHVYATAATLDQLQEVRRTNERLRLTHQRLKGEFDRMTGPQTILRRAAALGLDEGVAYGPSIRLAD